jgi:heat shock protein HslJ
MIKGMRHAFALALIPVALLGSCATAPSKSTALSDTRWTIMRIDGVAPVMPEKAAMQFEQGRLGASVGCNGIGGEYRIEGTRLIAGPLMATRMFCEGAVWQQEEAVNALLSAAPEILRSNKTLRLTSGGHMLELELR